MLYVVFELANTLSDVIKCTMSLLLLIEQIRVSSIHDYLETSHIQYSIVQKLVESGHVIHQK